MALGMEVGLGLGHVVLDGDPAPLPKREQSRPILGLFLLWPNGWMHQDAIGMEVGLSPGYFVFDCSMATQLPPEKRAHQPHPIFDTCLLWSRSSISATGELL